MLVVSNYHKVHRDEIRAQLKKLSVDENKVVFLMENEQLKTKVFTIFNHYDEHHHPRVVWLAQFSQYVKSMNIFGNVAECGVYLGEFAEFINKYFSDRKLYLFDTFDGFSEDELEIERSFGEKGFLESGVNTGESYKVPSLDMVRHRMPYIQQCEFHVGFFPESAKGIKDKFCFVTLDTDLYKPILAGLEFFYPQMVAGGVILIHDFFSPAFPGVKKAVKDYEDKYGERLHKIPIADNCSIAVVK